MSRLILNETSLASFPTPATGKGHIMADSTASLNFYQDDSGRWWGSSFNAAVASQSSGGFATNTYVTNSNILVPSFGVQARTTVKWEISASKTAASTATPVYTFSMGANASTADTVLLQLTGPAQTAAVDVGILLLMITFRTVGSGTSAVIAGTACWKHNVAAGGFANSDAGAVEGTSAGFDSSASAGKYIGISMNGGTSSAWTLTQVRAEAAW